jgi:hypothetical protein
MCEENIMSKIDLSNSEINNETINKKMPSPIFLSHINDIKLGYKKPILQLENKKFLFKRLKRFKLR